ncbi:MAG: hypothetical protein PW843_20530 [Azospirillaceae bacterium]|nr:hypothetical protein [Azospirillaceae bacterium]
MTSSVQSALSSPRPDPSMMAGAANASANPQAGQVSGVQGGQDQGFQDQVEQAQAGTTAGQLPAQAGTATAAAVGAHAKADNHMSFWDFVDVINPLQHIPVVSTIYREITGDTIKTPAKILGGMLYGGPIGFALATGDAIIQQETGDDVEGHIMSALGIEHHHQVGEVTPDPDGDGGGKRRGGQGASDQEETPDQSPTAGRAPVAAVETTTLGPQKEVAAAAAPVTAPAAAVADAMRNAVATKSGPVPGVASALKPEDINRRFPNMAAVPAMAVGPTVSASSQTVNPTQAMAEQASQITNATQAMQQAANATANVGVGTQSMPQAAAPQLSPAQAAGMAGAGNHPAAAGQKRDAAHGMTLSNYRAQAGVAVDTVSSKTLVAPGYMQNIKAAAGQSTVLSAAGTRPTGQVAAAGAGKAPANTLYTAKTAPTAISTAAPAPTAAPTGTAHPAMVQVMNGGTAAPGAPAQQGATLPRAIQAYNNAMGQDTATLLAQATAASASANGTPAGPSAPTPSAGTLSASATPAGANGVAANTGAAAMEATNGGPPPVPKQFIADVMMANLAKYQAMKDAQGPAH